LHTPDWNATSQDEGYILNRPIFKITKEFVWLDETAVNAGQSSANFNAFTEGWENVEKVEVIFNREKYISLFSVDKNAANSLALVN
jgi:hypothetical protein